MFRPPPLYSTIPLSVPIKEGRQQPYYLLRQRRRAILQRSIALVVVGILVYTVVVARSVQARPPTALTTVADQGADHITIAEPPAKLEPVRELTLDLTAEPAPPPVVQPVEDEPARPGAVVEENHAEQNVFKIEQVQQPEPIESIVSPAPQVREDDPALELALQRVLSLLPDEMHIRELLRPVEGTGKEKLREIGLRSRAYKKFFEAWESLHIVTSNGQTYLRHDIVQYLRNHHVSADSTTLDFAQTVRSYEAFRYFLQRLSTLLFPWTAPYFPDHLTLHTHFVKGGRGLVFTAGDEQAPYLLISIKAFRKLGCTLPIEIMYLGDSDLGEDYRADLEALAGVITRDLSQMIEDEGWTLRGWAAKPFAILMSSFQEVIFVDADALFFKNPEILFDDPGYIETGALFFRDRLMMPESKQRWLQQILPKPISKLVKRSRMWTGESGHMQESGVVVVDKWRHFIALLLVTRMNGPDRDGNDEEGRIGVYEMVYGKSLQHHKLGNQFAHNLSRRQRDLLDRLGARRRHRVFLPLWRRRHHGKSKPQTRTSPHFKLRARKSPRERNPRPHHILARPPRLPHPTPKFHNLLPPTPPPHRLRHAPLVQRRHLQQPVRRQATAGPQPLGRVHGGAALDHGARRVAARGEQYLLSDE